MSRRLLSAVVTLAAAGAVLGAAGTARATGTLAAPTGAHVVATSSTSFVVTANRAANATRYRLFASTTESNLYVSNISRAHASSFSADPTIGIGGLRYTTAAYYYRVESLNSRQHRFDSAIHSVGLRPATPTGLRVATASHAPFLTWTSGAVTGYQVEQATDSAMTANQRTYSVQGAVAQLTPYGLTRGRTYYFRVRGVNHSTVSSYSTRVQATVTTSEQSLRVMTYNVLEASLAGTVESGAVLSTWEARRAGVVALIKQGAPDVVGIQEAAAWIGPTQGYGGVRQVDDLVQALGGTYALARTEVPPTERGYFRVGTYILYRTAAYQTVGAGGHWAMGDGHYAAYQLLRNRASGATVLAVAVHLPGGTGSAADAVRQQDAQSMIEQATAYAATTGAPIVYAGDFNSDLTSEHAFDGPGLAMRAARTVNTQLVAQALYYARYNSANRNLRTPPAFGHSIDYVYAGPGVAVQSRVVLINLVGGKFVGVIPSDHNAVQATLYLRY